MHTSKYLNYFLGSGYFASRGKLAPCYYAIWRQNSHKRYFASSAKIALAQTLIPNLALTLAPTLTQTEEKYYFTSRGKIATSNFLCHHDHFTH